jgi:hypothetical protein
MANGRSVIAVGKGATGENVLAGPVVVLASVVYNEIGLADLRDTARRRSLRTPGLQRLDELVSPVEKGEMRRTCNFDHHLGYSLLEFQEKCIVRALTPSDASRRHR